MQAADVRLLTLQRDAAGHRHRGFLGHASGPRGIDRCLRDGRGSGDDAGIQRAGEPVRLREGGAAIPREALSLLELDVLRVP